MPTCPSHLTGEAEWRWERPVYPACLGAIAARTGDVTAAHAYADTLAAMDRPYLFGYHTLGQAAIAARLGDPDRAVTLLRAALGQGVRFGTNLDSHPDLLVLRGYPPFDELMGPDG